MAPRGAIEQLTYQVGDFYINNSPNATVGNVTLNPDHEVELWLKRHARSLEFGSCIDYATFSGTRRDSLFELPEFQRCLQNNGQTLVVEGAIGTGKTTMMLGLLDKLDEIHDAEVSEESNATGTLCQQPLSTTITAGIQFQDDQVISRPKQKAAEEHHMEVSRILMCVLKQIHAKISEAQKAVQKLYELHEGRAPASQNVSNTIVEILDVVNTMNKSGIGKRRFTCVFVDALDECPQELRDLFLFQLKCIQEKTHIGLVFTDRVGVSRWRSIFKKESSRHSEMLKAHIVDIKCYLKKRLSYLKEIERWEGGELLLDETVDTVAKAAGGIFLLARLYLDCVASDSFVRSIRNSLNSIRESNIAPDTAPGEAIKEAYSWSINRMMGPGASYHNKKLARLALVFVRDAVRSLSIKEMLWLLTIDDTSFENNRHLEEEKPYEWKDVQACCHGLLEGDQKNRIHLVHRTLRDYLKRPEMLANLPSHTELAKRCLLYLCYPDKLSGHCSDVKLLQKRLDDFPLLEYAARYWHIHVRGSTEFQDDKHKKLGSIHRLLSQFLKSVFKLQAAFQITLFQDQLLTSAVAEILNSSEKPMTISLVFKQRDGRELLNPFSPNRMTGLHMASQHGFLELAIECCLIEEKYTSSLDDQNLLGYSALHYAVMGGHADIVQVLIKRGANVNFQDLSKTTPLILATATRNEKIATILLEKKGLALDVNLQTSHDHKWEEHEYEVLLRDGIPELQTIGTVLCSVSGRTALHYAARNDMEKTVEMLLNRRDPIHGTRVDIRDSDGQNAWHKAAKYGRLKIMKRLQGAGVCPKSRVGETIGLGYPTEQVKRFEGYLNNAMHFAAKYGRDEVVRYLLQTQPGMCNEKNAKGRTPLCQATTYGQVSTMNLILDHNSHSLNQPDEDGIHPLHYSVLNRSGLCLKLLLKRSGISVNKVDVRGWTPLHWAAIHGVASHVEQLLVRGDVNIRQKDGEGRTPLVLSAQAGNVQALQALWGWHCEQNKVLDEDLHALSRVLEKDMVPRAIKKPLQAILTNFRRIEPENSFNSNSQVAEPEESKRGIGNDQKLVTFKQATVEDYDESNEA